MLLSGPDTGSRPHSRASDQLETQDTVILSASRTASPEPEVGGAIESDNEDGAGLKVSKKRKRRLVSDSEDSEEELEENVAEKTDNTPEYDSDENEILKPAIKVTNKMFNKEGKLRQAFFEAEAELSDEEGRLGVSDDEEEEGMDQYEADEADLVEIDEEAELEKVGRIHQRVQLDKDQEELRLFQERFLEDGDLHTDYKRQRQFRWAGLDEGIEVGPRQDEDGGGDEEERAEEWRLGKIEREKWLKKHEKESQQSVDEEEAEDSQFFKLADKTLMRMSSKDDTVTEPVKKKVFKSPPVKFGPLQPLQNLVSFRGLCLSLSLFG